MMYNQREKGVFLMNMDGCIRPKSTPKRGWVNTCTLYIFLMCIYSLQDFLNFPTLLNRAVIFILLSLSIYYVYIANTCYKLPSFFKGLNMLLTMLVVYGAISILVRNGQHFGMYLNDQIQRTVSPQGYLFTSFFSLSPIYAFYVFTRQGKLVCGNLKYLVFILLAYLTYLFYANANMIMLANNLLSNTDLTNNVSYDFLSIVPLVFLCSKSKMLQIPLVAYVCVFVVLGLKRGAIIILALLLCFYLYRNLTKGTLMQRLCIIAMAAIALFWLGSYLTEFYLGNEYAQARIDKSLEGNSSGRDMLWDKLLAYYMYQASMLQLVFGSGADATLIVAGNYAHNDWLEILVNQGVMGIIVYLIYWRLFYKAWGKIRAYNDDLGLSMGCLFIIYFMSTFFSMSYSAMTLPSTMALGFCLAHCHNNINSSKTDKR